MIASHTSPYPPDLERFARNQHGHVTREQALAAGMTEAQVRGRLRRGDWIAFYPRVYRLWGVPESWEADVAACLLAAGPHAAVSHASAARLLGLSRPRGVAKVELTVPYGARTRPALPPSAAVRVHRTRELSAQDLTRAGGFAVTTVSRTLVDLAGRHFRHQAVALVDDAIGARLVTRTRLHARAVALRKGRPGVQHILDVTAPGAEGTFRSWLERHANRVLDEHGIRGGEWNVPVAGGRAVLDVLFRDADLPLEIDGPRFHDLPGPRRKDAARSNLLHRLGIHPLRFTYADLVEEPQRVAWEVRDALVSRGCAHLVS